MGPPCSPADSDEPSEPSLQARETVLILPGYREKRATAKRTKTPLIVTHQVEERKPPVNYESLQALPQVIALWQTGLSGGVTVKEELHKSAGRFEPKPLTEVVNYLNRKKL